MVVVDHLRKAINSSISVWMWEKHLTNHWDNLTCTCSSSESVVSGSSALMWKNVSSCFAFTGECDNDHADELFKQTSSCQPFFVWPSPGIFWASLLSRRSPRKPGKPVWVWAGTGGNKTTLWKCSENLKEFKRILDTSFTQIQEEWSQFKVPLVCFVDLAKTILWCWRFCYLSDTINLDDFSFCQIHCDWSTFKTQTNSIAKAQSFSGAEVVFWTETMHWNFIMF